MRKLFIGLFIGFSVVSLNASHIIGGDFYLTHISGNDFEVTMIMFRDCGPGNFTLPNEVDIEVYEEGTNAAINLLDFTMPLISQEIIPLGDNCFEPSICLERGVFQGIFTFPDNVNGYYLSFQLCCRNDIIDNILTPDDVGMVFTTSFPDPLIQNSSPQFGDYPLQAYFCANGNNEIDFSATDIDGDSLVYSLDTPLIGTTDMGGGSDPGIKPYTGVAWAPGYDLSNIVGGSPAMAIDSETGVITASPDMLLQFVFAIKIEEYRDGVKIGEVRREIQFDSFVCSSDAPAEISWDVVSTPSYIIEPNKPFCIDIESQDVNIEDTLFLFLDSEILDTAFFPAASFTPVLGVGNITGEFCWTPDCSSLRDEPYEIHISSFSTGCTDSTFTSEDAFQILVQLPEDIPTDMIFPLDTGMVYIMDGEEHCFFVQLEDIDCYDTLSMYADTSQYIFTEAGIKGIFNPTPPALFNASGEFCWRPQCPDITFEPGEYHTLDFYVDSRKCDVVNTYKYPLTIKVFPETDGFIKLPNVFTPNEDEFNASFTTFDHTDFCIRQFSLELYNRWGNIVFSTTDKDFAWDGVHQDTELDCAPGVYYYIINYDVFGNDHTYTGDITLVR